MREKFIEKVFRFNGPAVRSAKEKRAARSIRFAVKSYNVPGRDFITPEPGLQNMILQRFVFFGSYHSIPGEKVIDNYDSGQKNDSENDNEP